ncbi:beta-galactosidase [Plantactinospora soyae]|uniref:Beta-galactosidase n=1 Tax=Plantactinospora soyae TaxID=1544732 RepID=A0A927MEL5_9ACTN|nr:beta-galactosidase [Plantactinospora soyae]MBE1492245.1 beta-galactosidase [Plantactinospora soyae]
MRWPGGLTGLCYGGDYNPEQWPPELWPADVELMRRARVNLVTVGVFAWSRLEPQPGRYDFEWLDRVLDLLYDGGIRVALATPTASPPPWFSLRHPEGLPVTADGVRLSHGSRDTYCVSAPAYRTAARKIASALAGRYGDHPALALWHVHNEYGTTCHCEHVAAAFRNWLRVRYVELDRLNEAWTGSFWSQYYSDWEQIRPPRATQYLGNPGQLLDFRRFLSDELLGAYVEQRDLLRAATPEVPVTTNYVLGGWVPVDHTRWSTEVDLVAIDHYPGEAGPGAEEQTAFAADLARCWGRRAVGGPSWLLMESAPNLVLTPGRMHAKEPGRMIRHSLAHVARGSRGAMFFQWRASRGGAELFHSALLPHAGPQTRAFEEAVALGATLDRLAEVDSGVVQAPVAIAWDAACWWGMQAVVLPSEQLDYLAEVSAAHRSLWRAGLGVDVVAPGDELSGYALLVLPALYLVSDAYARQVRDYVAAGGHLVVGYFSGIADEHGRVRLDGYPGAFRDLLGIRVEEFHPLDAAERLPLSDGTSTGRLWSETVRLTGAEPVLTYVGGVLDGRPAVTRHRYGDGVAWYVSTRLGDDAYRELLAGVAGAAGVGPTCPGAPDGVEAVRRRTAGESWLFLLNHTDVPQTVPASGVDLLTGVRAESVTLPAGGCAVLRER